MTGPQHYEEAERLTEMARWGNDDRELAGIRLAAASVHAQLATAAALGAALAKDVLDDAGPLVREAREWRQVLAPEVGG